MSKGMAAPTYLAAQWKCVTVASHFLNASKLSWIMIPLLDHYKDGNVKVVIERGFYSLDYLVLFNFIIIQIKVTVFDV